MYQHWEPVSTRWHDNDIYGHVNNTVFYAYMDTVINDWLIAEGGLDIHDGDVIGLCVESHCEFKAPAAFPETLRAGLRVGHLGRSSVRYEIGIYRDDTLLAEGHFVHVFVEVAHHGHVLVFQVVAVEDVPAGVVVESRDDGRLLGGAQVDGVLPAVVVRSRPGQAAREHLEPGPYPFVSPNLARCVSIAGIDHADFVGEVSRHVCDTLPGFSGLSS